MTLDKYGTGQDPYCYPDSRTLRNRLDIRGDERLAQAERELSEIAASQIDFSLPPYDLAYLKQIHRELFQDVYEWAGESRTIDISKGNTRFCTAGRIEPEAQKIFEAMERRDWFEELDRPALIVAVAEKFGDLNMIHPFREGNGRAQRLLFEHLIVNAGFEISWWQVEEPEWIDANVAAVICDYRPLEAVFERCIGRRIDE
ncbi:putative adenosine monophosphate-protein transferase Fic [Burkholderia sp. SIMBA_062]|uniref:putative adenosine monophosphate-protein transferase Fic n=1 Tax=Burkholderia sp. SIMBA_062 TaxID=3085803 RepID=UPI00397C0704